EQAFQQSMGGIITNAENYRQIIDEAPTAYKDIERVVNVLADIGMVEKVARVVPLAVIKGSGE
ncbi:MAG TPA: RtcB family protein, partial [Firmicutes bacterium]|nr:RtcB family protein [Bacillota bacterium]